MIDRMIAPFKGGLLLFLGATDRLRGGRDILPVLNYHGIDEAGSTISLSPREFERQMDILADRRITVLAFREALDCLARPGPLPKRTVAITFDDGIESVYTAAFPVLRERGFGATVFLVTGAEGNRLGWEREADIPASPLMTPSQIREMHAEGFEFGAHTRTHPHLTEVDDERLDRELAGNRSDIAEIIGEAPETFAYPYGDHDGRVVEAVRRAGFRGACTITPPRRIMGRDPFRVERFDSSRFSGHKGLLARLFFVSCLTGVFADYVVIKMALPFFRRRTFEYKERRRRDASRR